MEYVPSDNEIPPVSEPILREGSMEHLKSRRQKIGDFLRGTLQQAKQLPSQAVGAAEAAVSAGSALGLMIPSFVSGAIRQEPAGAMLERSMYMPRTESGRQHLAGIGETLSAIPDVGLLPELQPFVGVSRGVGQQLQGAARRAGQAAAPVVAGAAEDVLRRQGLIMDVVKPKGGQFIGGDIPENIDKQLKSLMSRGPTEEDRQWLIQHAQQNPEASQRGLDAIARTEAINSWIQRNLSNYVKKEMGTPEDPVRKLAETGVTHIQERYNEPGLTTVIRRKEAGFPEEGMGQSPEARSWENLSDRFIDEYSAGEIQPQAGYIKDYEKLDKELYALTQQIRGRFAKERTERLIRQGETPENAQQIINDFIVNRNTGELARELNDSDLLKQYSTLRARTNYARDLLNTEYADILRENPWIEKLDPSTRLYTARTENLQFDHIVDVLRDDLDSGRIRPEQLSKVSMADAVRRTYEFDQEMAKKAEQAQAELANKLLQESPFKTYDNGYTWVKLPDPAESKENMKLVQDIGCQGGWCTQKESNALYYGAHAEGNNLYVLMSPDKRVHAQIHVQSPEKPYDFDALMSNPQTKAQAAQAVREWRQRNPSVNAPLEDEQIYQALREAGIPEAPPTISEIKPRANSWQSAMVADQIEKNPDYQPTIQRMLADFVKSTKYPVEYDLQNTGLIKFGSQYMMPDEAESIIRPQINEALNFLETHPRLQSFRDAQKKYEDAQYNKNISATEYHQLENQAGKAISASVPYTYQELKSILTNPENYVDRNESNFEVIDRILRGLDRAKKELGIEEKKADGGLVSNTDRIAEQLRANGMDEEAAFNRALMLANELQMAGGGEVKLAGGGRGAGKVLGKAAERAAKPAAKTRAEVVEEQARTFAEQIKSNNPKMSDEDINKRALRQAEAKIKWETEDKPELEERYGKLSRSTFSDPLSQRQTNVPSVVEARAKRAEEFLAQPTQPWEPPKPELQAFDRAAIKDALEGFPGIEQSRFPRYQPARAGLNYIDEVYDNPRNREIIKSQITRGLPLGGETFYASLYPVKLAAMEKGIPEEKFNQFIYSIAPASARNSIFNEMAVGQFLRDMKARGLPLDEDTVKKEMAVFKEKYGTGLPLMPIHRQGVQNVLEGNQDLRAMLQADIPTNYKIPTYGTQKAGDFAKSMVLDVHEAGGQTQASKYHPYFNEQGGFGPTEYGAAESKMLDIAQEMGLPGGMAQAGRWFGGGELTGLKSPRGDALDLLERQAAYTLQGLGVKPTPKNTRNYILNMIETGEGVLMPWFKKEGIPDVRTRKKKGGAVKTKGKVSGLSALRK